MEKDIKDFTRKLRLVEFFSENPELDTPESSLVKIKSNTKHYLKMISDHLNDETTYKMVELNCDTTVMKGITKITEKYKDNLTKKRKRISYKFLI